MKEMSFHFLLTSAGWNSQNYSTCKERSKIKLQFNWSYVLPAGILVYHTDEHELSVNWILTSSLGSKGKVEINDGSMHWFSCEIPDTACLNFLGSSVFQNAHFSFLVMSPLVLSHNLLSQYHFLSPVLWLCFSVCLCQSLCYFQLFYPLSS